MIPYVQILLKELDTSRVGGCRVNRRCALIAQNSKREALIQVTSGTTITRCPNPVVADRLVSGENGGVSLRSVDVEVLDGDGLV